LATKQKATEAFEKAEPVLLAATGAIDCIT